MLALLLLPLFPTIEKRILNYNRYYFSSSWDFRKFFSIQQLPDPAKKVIDIDPIPNHYLNLSADDSEKE